MFCRNCGNILNEEVEYCPQCGVNIHGTNIKKNIITQPKTIFVASIVVILVTIVALMCIKTDNINSSPEEVAIAVIKSEYEIDIETMMKCFPDFTIKEIAVDEGLSANASHSEIVKAVEKSYRYETPQKVKIIDSEVVGEYDISEYTIFRELYYYMTDKDYNSITKVAKVKVAFTVDERETSTQITCIKMKDKWYFLRKY